MKFVAFILAAAMLAFVACDIENLRENWADFDARDVLRHVSCLSLS